MEKELKIGVTEKYKSAFKKILKNDSKIIEKLNEIFGFENDEYIDTSVVKNIDNYYDTENFKLKEMKSLIRIRQENRKHILTVKFNQKSENGVFIRDEKNFSIKKDQIDDLLLMNFETVSMAFFPDLTNLIFTEVFSVINKRKIFNILKSSGEVFEIAIDDFYYQLTDKMSNEKIKTKNLFNIEIEAKNEQAELLLQTLSLKAQQFIPECFILETRSKYETGFALLDLLKPKQILLCKLKPGFILDLKKMKIIEAKNFEEAAVKFMKKMNVAGFCVGEIKNGKTIIYFDKIQEAKRVCEKLKKLISNRF